ncbi:TRAP-type C4-dicarboxylate transport system, small permease component [Desulfitobacterium dichloroeliminans LMG P-21439]|uniref:TRAP-type C4-dicarboxylate transport system, small permease component n=1 Tax=Desulfitobacterium dichloroeliminans (strain LMG P-21439 / DCA1) TaxID=871963 RepID=L0F5Y4_DESDL|nr:TRAP transporter small permease [Desulfitobacterium dichloroeliminans]AGA68041.1 TRAP-type C4-dicarboxylate transport system, small permease component [Desulfitobacterium dichloroeliminans LMG P-21439]
MGDTAKDTSKYKVLITLDNLQTKIEKGVVSLGLIFATLILFLNILYSAIAGTTVPWASEITQYIMVWVIFIGASLLMRSTGHVTMDLIARFISKKVVLYLDVFIYTIVCVFLAYLSYIGWNMTLDVYMTGQSMSTINASMAWVYLGFPVGVFLMAINALKLVAIKLRQAMRGEIT